MYLHHGECRRDGKKGQRRSLKELGDSESGISIMVWRYAHRIVSSIALPMVQDLNTDARINKYQKVEVGAVVLKNGHERSGGVGRYASVIVSCNHICYVNLNGSEGPRYEVDRKSQLNTERKA